MPFHSMTQDGALAPEDLDFLQDIYEAAASGVINIDDAAIHEAVRSLIQRYRAGERDRGTLVALAAGELQRAAG